MDVPATVVWLSPEPPDAQESRALSTWSQAHGVRLVPPRAEATPALAVDPHVGDAVESSLERARDAIAARDGAQADSALAAAEATLRAHAELPQGAWLMAEVLRSRATRWRRVPPVDADAADEAWRMAEGLDGGRVAGVGEVGAGGRPPAATVTVALSPEDAQAWLDGRPLASRTAATSAGLHALVVTWADVPVWAAWIDVAPGASSLKIAAGVAPPCSDDDVARARMDEAGSVEAGRVRCPEWIAAGRGTKEGAVRVARCASGRCAEVTEWQAPPAWSRSPPTPAPDERRRWPAWATWALLGGGAALAAGVAVVASGALQSAPGETRFVSGGIRSQ